MTNSDTSYYSDGIVAIVTEFNTWYLSCDYSYTTPQILASCMPTFGRSPRRKEFYFANGAVPCLESEDS